MPSSNFIDGRPKPPPPEAHEHQLPCPRCDSTNTKFCYYNNYNLAQPRHFCKACRRYWTHGGTLRNVPIGGGTRKNSTKRPRTMSSTTTSPTSSASNNNNNTTCYDPISATPVSSQYPTMTDRHHPHSHHTHHHQQQQQHLIPLRHDVDLNDAGNVSSGVGSLGFTSLLQSQGPNGFLALGGFGLGFEDLGLAGIWPSSYGEISDGGIATHHHHHTATGVVGLGTGGGATWQFGNGGDLGYGDSDGGFAWPELAISTTTPRKSIK